MLNIMNQNLYSLIKNKIIIPLMKILLFPYFNILESIKKNISPFKKLLGIYYTIYILFPLWILFILLFSSFFWLILVYTGTVKIEIPTQGSSMLPTIRENSKVYLKVYPQIDLLGKSVGRGDIVVFSNKKTVDTNDHNKEINYVKRIVGVPGDSLIIRDGFIWVNGKLYEEPYTLKSRSTFGGKEIKDCNKITVPDRSFFVLGDNRKRSLDSRDIGIISEDDIRYYLPFKEQNEYILQWRDASKDKSYANTPVLNVQEYIRLINIKRKEYGSAPLQYNRKLSISAEKRAVNMLNFDDFTVDGEKSKYPMINAIKEAGYENILYAEYPVLGYYDKQELLDYILEFPETKEFLINKDYQDIGISTFIGELNGCPVQIVNHHVGGYIPPSYTKEQIEVWETIYARLKDVQPGWKDLKNNIAFYQLHTEDIDRINEIIDIRLKNVESIIRKMKANIWLNGSEVNYTYEDEKLHLEQQEIADSLNSG